jgi:hypothetical protein
MKTIPQTIQETVQVFTPAGRTDLFPPEIKLTDKSKIDISVSGGAAEDARWVICTLLSILGEFTPANHPNANN